MAQFDKWIEGIRADDTVSDTAANALRARLAAVQYYLPLAAERADEDVEYVHELRVYTRRSLAALTLYADLLRKQETKWIRKQLRRVRRAAGKARDLDMLAQSHESNSGKGGQAFLTRVRRRRKKAQRPIVAVQRDLNRDDRLRRRVEALLETTAKQNSDSANRQFGQWATWRLRKILKRFFKASPADLHDLAGLHLFRICGKELRYTVELLASAFPATLRDDLYPIIEQLQERLGDIHDRVIASARFEKWAVRAKCKKEAGHMRKLLEQERNRLEESLQEFTQWWTPEFQTQLRDSFDQFDATLPATARVPLNSAAIEATIEKEQLENA